MSALVRALSPAPSAHQRRVLCSLGTLGSFQAAGTDLGCSSESVRHAFLRLGRRILALWNELRVAAGSAPCGDPEEADHS